MTELKCPVCGKVFAPKRKDSRCCSSECTVKLYRTEHRKVYKKICIVCKSEFETTNDRRKYCCILCAEAARAKRELERQHKRKETNEIKVCEQCGAQFQPKTKRSRFCSRACVNIHNRAMAVKKAIEPRKCAMCGEEFVPSCAAQKYCGENCRKAAERERTYKYEAKKKPHAEEYTSSTASGPPSPRGLFPRGGKCPEDKRGTPGREGNTTAASQRWATMSLKEISTECARLHLTYGQAQVMAQNGTLPEDFGKLKNSHIM